MTVFDKYLISVRLLSTDWFAQWLWEDKTDEIHFQLLVHTALHSQQCHPMTFRDVSLACPFSLPSCACFFSYWRICIDADPKRSSSSVLVEGILPGMTFPDICTGRWGRWIGRMLTIGLTPQLSKVSLKGTWKKWRKQAHCFLETRYTWMAK